MRYSAIVYTRRFGEPEFLVDSRCLEEYFFPKVEMAESEQEGQPDRIEVPQKISMTVRLDKVFRHAVWDSHGNACIFYLAEAGWDEAERLRLIDEETSLEWIRYDGAIKTITDETCLELLKHATAYLAVKYCLRNPVKEFGYIWYREHAVDIHSHIIVGADDGAQSNSEAMELLNLDREEGIQCVFATPHYGEENVGSPERKKIQAGFSKLNESAVLSSAPVKVFLGTEWYCSEHILERIRNKEAFPMGNSDWYMVEFMEWDLYSEDAETILRRLKMMRDNGIKTILAHPERYKAIQQDWDLAKRICDMGVLLQVNAFDLYMNPKDATRDLAQWMAKEEMISFIGSDMHGTRIKENGKQARRPQMKEGIRWLYDNVDDEEYVNEIVRVNAEKYLGVDRLLE